jgi:hypothetical protein
MFFPWFIVHCVAVGHVHTALPGNPVVPHSIIDVVGVVEKEGKIEGERDVYTDVFRDGAIEEV